MGLRATRGNFAIEFSNQSAPRTIRQPRLCVVSPAVAGSRYFDPAVSESDEVAAAAATSANCFSRLMKAFETVAYSG